MPACEYEHMDTLYAIGGSRQRRTIRTTVTYNPSSKAIQHQRITKAVMQLYKLGEVCWLYNIIFPSTCLWCVHALQPNVKPTISLLTLAISNGRGGEGLSTTERGAYTCQIFVKLFRAGFTAITILYVLPYMFPYIAAADATDTTRPRCNILANLGKL